MVKVIIKWTAMWACAKSIWAKGQTKSDSNSDCATNLAVCS